MDLGSTFGLKVLCLVGGQNINDQQKLMKQTKHHIIVGTPGRILYHAEHSKMLKLHKIKYFVLDEADQMLGTNFDTELPLILTKIPEKRKTYLFSATMSKNVSD